MVAAGGGVGLADKRALWSIVYIGVNKYTVHNYFTDSTLLVGEVGMGIVRQPDYVGVVWGRGYATRLM